MREILQYPDHRLTTAAWSVKTIDESVRQIVDEMREICIEHHALGLAAPQIGETKCIIVVKYGAEYVAIVNPELSRVWPKVIDHPERCLSVEHGQVVLSVKRHKIVVVTGLDENGKPVKYKAQEFYAYALQHEIDHLKGKLIVSG
ncbi:MAG: peptide deformylase [Dehalococcoidales bacterium]|nr:peptide deformylase [Dehalococcoidales bacterium]